MNLFFFTPFVFGMLVHLKLALVYLFFLNYCFCFELNTEAIPCNRTSDCQMYINICQITECNKGYCEFEENVFEANCCTKSSDCSPKDCEDVVCSENICEYSSTSECVGMGDIIGFAIGCTIFSILIVAFICVVLIIVIRAFIRKRQANNNTVDISPAKETEYSLPPSKTFE